MEEFVDFRALQPDQLPRQPAVFVDPLSNIVRINLEQSVRDKRERAGMKPEHGARRNANVLAREIAGEERAGGSTHASDADVVFLRRELLPLLLIEIDEPAMVVGNLDGFRPRRRRRQNKQNRKGKPPKFDRGCPRACWCRFS